MSVRRTMRRGRRRLGHALAWASVAILGAVLLALWLTPVKPPPRDPLSLLLWARPQRPLFLGIRVVLPVAAVAAVAASFLLGRRRTWLLLAWIVALVGGFVLFGDRFAGMARAWRIVY